MTRATYGLDETIRAYLLENQPAEHALLAELRELTATMTRSRMQISPEQGHFLSFLIRLTGARRVLEVGTYTGYSSICMAFAMPPDGRIVACDNSVEWTDVAKRFWKKAGLADRIELRLGSALDSFEALIKERQEFDFIFIDANKEDYDLYYEFFFEAGAAERSHRHRQHVARRPGCRSQRHRAEHHRRARSQCQDRQGRTRRSRPADRRGRDDAGAASVAAAVFGLRRTQIIKSKWAA